MQRQQSVFLHVQCGQIVRQPDFAFFLQIETIDGVLQPM